MRRVGSLKVIDGGENEMGWDTAILEKHISSNIQGDCDQCHWLWETVGNNNIPIIN
jgi:hypothetical protein